MPVPDTGAWVIPRTESQTSSPGGSDLIVIWSPTAEEAPTTRTVANLAADFRLLAETSSWRGTYTDTTMYVTGDLVAHDGRVYVARQDVTGVSPADAASWRQLSTAITVGTGEPADGLTAATTLTIDTGDGAAQTIELTDHQARADIAVLDAGPVVPTWTSGNAYEAGALVVYLGRVYRAVTDLAGSYSQPATSSHWVDVDGQDKWRGSWYGLNTYYRGDIVYQSDHFFVCTAEGAHQSNVGPVADVDNWDPVGIYRDTWVEDHRYEAGDIVMYSDAIWIASETITASTDHAPGVHTAWRRIDNVAAADVAAWARTGNTDRIPYGKAPTLTTNYSTATVTVRYQNAPTGADIGRATTSLAGVMHPSDKRKLDDLTVPTGNPDGRKYLRDDSVWSTLPHYRGSFTTAAVYTAGDIVSHSGGIWIATQSKATGTAFVASGWRRIDNVAGTVPPMRGRVAAATTYNAGDWVLDFDGIYRVTTGYTTSDPLLPTELPFASANCEAWCKFHLDAHRGQLSLRIFTDDSGAHPMVDVQTVTLDDSWSAGTWYHGAMVFHSGNLWLCTVSSDSGTTQEPGSSASDWRQI